MTDQITQQIDHLLTLDQEATAGPWSAESPRNTNFPGKYVSGPRDERSASQGPVKIMEPLFYEEVSASNADLIAASRNLAPAMARALKAVLELHHSRWTDGTPPGGYICAACLEPVESEPCATVQDIYDAMGMNRA